jgi:hypothetical protein
MGLYDNDKQEDWLAFIEGIAIVALCLWVLSKVL